MDAEKKPIPVGRIDYLGANGKVRESSYHYTEEEFLKTVKEENHYGVPMVVNVFRRENGQTIPFGFALDLDPPPQGFKILNYVEGEDMNEFQRLEQLAKQYKALYPKGTRILLQMMGSDPRPIEPGTRGTVDHVDDLGTIHCRFDNGRYLGIIPEEDSFRKLTKDEILDEQSEKLQSEFIEKINTEVIPYIGWDGIRHACETGSTAVPTDLLKWLHEEFVKVYGSDHIEPDNGMVTVPGVVQAADGKLYVALLTLDAESSGEHWGTTFFTPKGVLSDYTEDPEIMAEIKKMCPYNYWYTVEMERDHHVNWDTCPEQVKEMLQTAIGMDQTDEVTLQ